MNARMIGVAVLVAFAGSCFGQGASQIDVKGRIAGTTDWVDVIDTAVVSFDPVIHVEVAVFYRWDATNGAVAMSTCVNSPVVNGWNPALDAVTLLDRADSSQHPDGRQGNFNFGGQSQQAYRGGTNDAGRLRIAAPNNAQAAKAGGVSIKQNTPVALGASLDTSNPVLGYRFDITLSLDYVGGEAFRTLNADVPLNLVNTYRVYKSFLNSEVRDDTAMLLPTDPLTIRFYIPAPSACVVLSGGLGLMAMRRRR